MHPRCLVNCDQDAGVTDDTLTLCNWAFKHDTSGRVRVVSTLLPLDRR